MAVGNEAIVGVSQTEGNHNGSNWLQQDPSERDSAVLRRLGKKPVLKVSKRMHATT
jgi:hypothetical protein